MIDWNPIRVWMSVADRLKTSLARVNLIFNLLTIDWWLVGIGVMSLGVAICVERTAPAYWPFAVAGILLVPYIAYMILAFFWRPVPFFMRVYTAFPIEDGTYDATVFGEWEYEYEVPHFVGAGKTIKRGRARAFWSLGTVTVAGTDVAYRVHAKANVLNSRFMGIMTREFAGRADLQEAEIGLATLLWRRVPALKMKSEGHVFVLALKGKARHEESADSGSAAVAHE